MSAKSYAESARPLSTNSTSLTTATSANADYPPILAKPITPTATNKNDLANKALAVVAANTAPSAPNVWATRMQNTRREDREQRDKEEDYDPFVVRRFDHHAPSPAHSSTNGNSAQAWPTIGNKPIRDKAQVKWPPARSSSPSQSPNERGSSSSSAEPRAAKPAPVPVSNQSKSAAAPTPPPPTSQPIPPPTPAPASSSKTYTFGSIDVETEARHKRQELAEAERNKQSDVSWNIVNSKKSKKDKGKKIPPETHLNGKESAGEANHESEASAIENGLPPVLGVSGVPEPVKTSLAIMFPPSRNKAQPSKRPPAQGKTRPKDKASSAKRILVGGDDDNGVLPSLQVNDVKWRFTVDTDDDLSVRGIDTPPAGSGTLSPLVMDHTLTMLRSTQTSTPSLSPVVLSQTMGVHTPQTTMTPPVATSPAPSPSSNHQLFAQNGKSSPIPGSQGPSSAVSDDFEVKDFGYGFGGLDVATVKRSHEQRMAELERSQHERAYDRERMGEEYSPNRHGDHTELNGSARGQRRGYGGRGYGDGRGRRGFNPNGRGGGRGMRYPRPPYDPNSPISPGEGGPPYPYPPHMPPYGYPMPYYPPGPFDYGAYYNYPPYMPPQQSPTTYSPSHYPLLPPPFDMTYPPPPPPHIAQSGPVPVPITRVPFPLDPLRYYLLGQLEYYLSPDNVVHDFYLRQQMDSQGFVPVSLIASFNRAQRLTTSIELIKEVLSYSSIAEVRGDHVRMKSWQQWVLPGAAPSTVDVGGNEEEQDVSVMPTSGGETNGNDKDYGQSN